MKKRLTILISLSSALFLAFPALAFAEEEGGPGIGLVIPKMGEFIPMLLGFLILWFVLAKFAWPAFIGMIDKRTATIKDSLERAEVTKIEGERLLEEQKALLDDAKKQATLIIADAKTTADGVRAELLEKAQEDARILVEKASGAIALEKKQAIAELQKSVADLTISVAGKVIGSDLNDAEHRKIIEHALAEAGNFDDN
jgi:F-type H+-transporting ATPase subunit b